MSEIPLISLRVAVAALLGVLGIVVLTLSTSVRVGVLTLALYAGAGALARIVLPPTAAFAVRSRLMDATVLIVLAGVLVFLGLTTPLE